MLGMVIHPVGRYVLRVTAHREIVVAQVLHEVEFGGQQGKSTAVVFGRYGGGGQSQALIGIPPLRRDPFISQGIALLNRILDAAAPFADDSQLFNARLQERFRKTCLWLGRLWRRGGGDRGRGERV